MDLSFLPCSGRLVLTTIGTMVFIDDNILIQKWDKNYLLSKNKCFDAVRYCYTVYSSLLFEHYNRILLCD